MVVVGPDARRTRERLERRREPRVAHGMDGDPKAAAHRPASGTKSSANRVPLGRAWYSSTWGS